jgi:hypothetical protein
MRPEHCVRRAHTAQGEERVVPGLGHYPRRDLGRYPRRDLGRLRIEAGPAILTWHTRLNLGRWMIGATPL